MENHVNVWNATKMVGLCLSTQRCLRYGEGHLLQVSALAHLLRFADHTDSLQAPKLEPLNAFVLSFFILLN